MRAAEEAGLAGNVYAAVDHLETALTELDDPEERSRPQRLLGRLLARTGSAARARDVLPASAASGGSADAAGVARALTDAVIPSLRAGDPAQACEVGRRALALAARTDPPTEIAAMVALSTALILSGAFAEGRDLALRAVQLADASGDLDGDLQLRSYLGGALRLAGEYDRARNVLTSVVAEARSRGAAGVLAYGLVQLGDLELDEGRWAVAGKPDAGGRSGPRDRDKQGPTAGSRPASLAWLAAAQGRERESRERAAEALRLADRLGVGSRLARAAHAHGLLELSLGRFDLAAVGLADIRRLKLEQGWSDAAVPPHWAPDLIEALALADRVDDARRELASFEVEASQVGLLFGAGGARALSRPAPDRRGRRSRLRRGPIRRHRGDGTVRSGRARSSCMPSDSLRPTPPRRGDDSPRRLGSSMSSGPSRGPREPVEGCSCSASTSPRVSRGCSSG